MTFTQNFRLIQNLTLTQNSTLTQISTFTQIKPCIRFYVSYFYGQVYAYRNRNLKTSKALLKSQTHQGTSLFTSAATNERGVSKGGQEKLRSEFQSTRRGQSSC